MSDGPARPWWRRRAGDGRTVVSRSGGVIVHGDNNVVVTGAVTLAVDSAISKEIAKAAEELADAERLVEQLRGRESELLRQVADATRERDDLRERLARVIGQLAESRANAREFQERLAERIALAGQCGHAEQQVEAVSAELARVRDLLERQTRRRDAIRPRHTALAQAGPYVKELTRRDQTLAWTLVVMAVGAVAMVLYDLSSDAAVAFGMVATPLAAVVIVGEAAYRRRGTAALTIMIPTLGAFWLSTGDLVGVLTVGCSLAVALVVIVDYRSRHRGKNTAAATDRARRVTGRVIIAVAAAMPVAAVGAALAGAAAAGWAYAAFLIAFTGVVAQTTWEPDLRARQVGAGAGLLFAAIETLATVERMASGSVVPDTAAGPAGAEVTASMALTALTLFGVLAALAIAAFVMTFDLRAPRRRR
ncbi:hypothetical protein [Pilimelia columellifera]|uniref:Uncharacterized protein n=1 Tax=Pilimelia columellifera subsp. columellifera TaxID=706583 RepID=A0ABP6AGM3_9ACTN